MNYTEQLERETERTRVELANTVEELRERLTPGEVLDEVIDYASDGEIGDFVRNFRRQVVDNPLPLGLLGVSVAWLVAASAFGGRRHGQRMREAGAAAGDRLARRGGDFASGARDAGRAFADRSTAFAETARDTGRAFVDRADDFRARAVEEAGDIAGRTADRIGDMAGRASDQAASIAGQASEQMTNVAEQANAAAGRVGERMRSAAAVAGTNLAAAGDGLTESMRSSARAMSDAATGIARSGRSASRAFADFGRQQPLIVAATGLVLGAIIGALLPSTQIEDELVGETSDAAKERLRAMAGEQYEKAKDIAERTVDAALGADDSSRAPTERHQEHEFGPGPRDHADAEHGSGDHPAGAEEAEHNHAGGG